MQDDYPLPDDGTAEEIRLRETEREMAEEALAEAQEALARAGQQEAVEQANDSYAKKREELGFDLAWWAEDGEHGSPPIDIVSDIANTACGQVHFARDLAKFGFDPSEVTGTITLDAVTGPLFGAGLQILGTLHSHIRDEIEAALKVLFDAMPQLADEQIERFNEAALAIQKDQFNGMGIQFLPPEEFEQQFESEDEPEEDEPEEDEPPTFNANNN